MKIPTTERIIAYSCEMNKQIVLDTQYTKAWRQTQNICKAWFHLNKNWPKLIYKSCKQSIKWNVMGPGHQPIESFHTWEGKHLTGASHSPQPLLQGICQTAADGHLAQAVSCQLHWEGREAEMWEEIH